MRLMTRVAYKDEGIIVKMSTHFLGDMQSESEKHIWDTVPEKFRKHFNPIYEVGEGYQKCGYLEPYSDFYLHIWDHPEDKFTMNMYGDWDEPIPYIKDSRELEAWLLSEEINICELRSGTNFGVNEDNDMVFIDYGMTSEMLNIFEQEIAEGNLPYLVEDDCKICGVNKEIENQAICHECKGSEPPLLENVKLLRDLVDTGKLQAEGSEIYVYRDAGEVDPEGWYLENIYELAKELEPEQVEYLKGELKS